MSCPSLSLIFFLLSAVALAAACNPMNGTCPPIPAMPSSKSFAVTKENPDLEYIMPGRINASSNGLDFFLSTQGDAPTIISKQYFLFGNVKAQIRVASGIGMVSALVLMSDVLDEVDWEWLGSDNANVQTNYFYQGETASYNRGGKTLVNDPQSVSHVYEVDWTETSLRWIIDGVTVRTLNKADTIGYGYPSTPSQIKIGVWASGDPTNPEGTIQWGGGPINYSKGPYKMRLESLKVISYTSASSFSYHGTSGTLASVVTSNEAISPLDTVASPPSGMAANTAQNTKAGQVIQLASSSSSSGSLTKSASMSTKTSSSTASPISTQKSTSNTTIMPSRTSNSISISQANQGSGRKCISLKLYILLAASVAVFPFL